MLVIFTPLTYQVYVFRLKPSGSSDADPFRATCLPLPVGSAVQSAIGFRFWLRRNTPEPSVTAAGLSLGFTSTLRSARIEVISSSGEAAGLYVKTGTGVAWVVFTTSLATTAVISQPPT